MTRRVWAAAGLLVAVFVAATALSAWRFQMAVRTSNAFGPPRSLESRLIGRTAPDLPLPLPSGATVHLETYRGQVVILAFWSSF